MRTAIAKHFDLFSPPPKLTVSEWADAYRYLSPESSASPGKWYTIAYQREMMDAINDPSVDTLVIMSSAQIGKSSVIENILGYYISHDPSPILIVQPTVEMAQGWSKERLAPMLRDTPCLSDKVKDPRSRDSGNTLRAKSFPGGFLAISGSNSPAGLASRPIRVVLADEVDRWPESSGTEGDGLRLAFKRTTTYFNRKKVVVSTPTVKGKSRIESAYLESDQRRYFVPCIHCGSHQTFKWQQVKLGEMPHDACYCCEFCGCILTDSDRMSMVHRGEWRSGAASRGIAGFHLNELYSPWRSLADIVSDYMAAERGGKDQLQVWVNTSLGEPYEPEVKAAVSESHVLKYRSETARNLVPEGTARLALLIDTQQAGFYYQLWALGYAPAVDMHMVRHGIVEAFEDLEGLLADTYTDVSGNEYRISTGLIDSGGTRQGWQKHSRTVEVYAWCARNRVIMPHKGMHGRTGDLITYKSVTTFPGTNKPIPGGLKRANIRVDMFKDELARRLSIEPDDKGALSFHCEIDEAFSRHYSAEYMDEAGDWIHDRKRGRNDYWDCTVYALALREMIKLRIPRQPGTEVVQPKPQARSFVSAPYRGGSFVRI